MNKQKKRNKNGHGHKHRHRRLQKRSESLFGLSWGGNNPISPQTQITAATETGPMYGGPQGNPNVAGNTYANAPTQFTNVRGGSAFYPDAAPDTMFRGLGNGITGGFKGKLLDELYILHSNIINHLSIYVSILMSRLLGVGFVLMCVNACDCYSLGCLLLPRETLICSRSYG